MAHFAQIDENNVVINVIVVANFDCLDELGNESEEVGAAFCSNILGGRWIQTSYNNNMRKRYAGIGYLYSEEHDVFMPPQPGPESKIDENYNWA